jgi:hypothetical protein
VLYLADFQHWYGFVARAALLCRRSGNKPIGAIAEMGSVTYCGGASSAVNPRRVANVSAAAGKDELEERAPDRCGHPLRQVKEQCQATETTLLLSIERSHDLRATA